MNATTLARSVSDRLNGRHALFRPAGAHHRTDLVAADVLRDDDRPREVRAGLAAHRVAAVAEAALRHEERLARADLFRRIRLLRHGLRRPL